MTVEQDILRPPARVSLMPVLRAYADSPFVPLICIGLVLTMQAALVFNRAINWDEFYHYSQVELFIRGNLSQPLQTFYVRLFQWLPLLPGTGVDHIVFARIFMFACEIVAAMGIVILAARFTDRTTGLLCVLAYLSSGFVLQHGFSFRTDPMLAALLVSALCVLGCTRFRGGWIAVFGVLLALAAMLSIKFVLYAPAFVGLAWWRWKDAGYGWAFPLRVVTALSFGVVAFGLLYLYHSTAGVTVQTAGEAIVQNSANKMFFIGIPIYWMLMLKFVSISVFLVGMIVLFPLALFKSDLGLSAKVALGGLFLPITALAFYFNSLPYFYTFILPPVAIACALPIAMVTRRYGAAIVAVSFALLAANIWLREDRGVLDRQRQIQTAARAIFPGSISYFDFCGILPWQDKANAFMTLWGAENYRQGFVPPMREVMQKKTVPLVVEMGGMFTDVLTTNDPQPMFLPQDVAAMRETYLPFWGPFWVAGKKIPANARAMDAEFLVPGPYTLSGGAIEVDGRRVEVGEVVRLDRGVHSLAATGAKAAQLTWGNHLRKPEGEPPDRPYWTFF